MKSFTPESSAKATSKPSLITYRDFLTLARRQNWTPESLVERFKGKFDAPSEFFHRVMSGKYPDVVISFRSVISIYCEHLQSRIQLIGRGRVCACGCGQPVFDRKKWATPGCKKRIARQAVSNCQKGVRQVAEFSTAEPGQTDLLATKTLTTAQTETSGR